MRSDATAGTRYLIRGYNDAAGTPTEVFSVGADGTVTADGLTVDGAVSVVSALPRIILEENDATDLNTAIRNNGGVFKIQTVNDAANSFTNRMDINHSSGDVILYGNLLVGKTSASTNTVGVEARADGTFAAVKSGGGAAVFGRNTDNGTIVTFRKDGTTVGSIGTTSAGNFAFFTPSEGGIETAAVGILPMNDGVRSDNETDLGFSGARFKDLYLSGGVYLGGTGSANKLDDYEEGTFTVVIADAASGGNTGSGSLVGTYTKIGNTVNITLRVVNINTTGMTASNDFYIRGLPFPAIGTDSFGIGPVMCDRINFTNYVIAQVVPSQSYLVLKNITDSGSDDEVKVSDITASGGSDILASVQYFTNA